MEDNATRAIMIGVGIFIIVMVISGVILYINAARNMATVVDSGLNSWDDITYNNIMDYGDDIAIKCKGIDFINFLRKYYMRDDIYFTISETTDIGQNLSIAWWKNENTDGISEAKIAKINTTADIVMKKNIVENSNGEVNYYITIDGELFSNRDAYVTDSVWNMERDSEGNYSYVTDGNVVLEIGDSINYVTSASSGTTWKVLGAKGGRILLLGDTFKQIELNPSKLKSNEVKLNDFNTVFSGWDDGNKALKGSARCFNFSDIERLTGIDHASEYTSYGLSYTLSWKSTNQIIVNDSYTITSNDGNFYWYNNSTQKFVRVGYAELLPQLVDSGFVAYTNSTGVLLEGLSTKASNMLNKSSYVFLMNISTQFSQERIYYTAKVLNNNKIKESNIMDIAGANAVTMTYYVRPVIALEQNVKLEKISEANWSISN